MHLNISKQQRAVSYSFNYLKFWTKVQETTCMTKELWMAQLLEMEDVLSSRKDYSFLKFSMQEKGH